MPSASERHSGFVGSLLSSSKWFESGLVSQDHKAILATHMLLTLEIGRLYLRELLFQRHDSRLILIRV